MYAATFVKILALGLGLPLLGAVGWLGTACASHLYADHLLIDQARAAETQRVQQAAEQVRQFQQQQQAPASTAAPALPPAPK